MRKQRTHNTDGTMRWTANRNGQVFSKDGNVRLVYIWDVTHTYWIVELLQGGEWHRDGDGATLRNAKHDAQLTINSIDNGTYETDASYI